MESRRYNAIVRASASKGELYTARQLLVNVFIAIAEFSRNLELGAMSTWPPNHPRRYNMLNSNSHTTPQERWPSGLRRTLGKRVYSKGYPGFESLSLRHTLFQAAAFVSNLLI